MKLSLTIHASGIGRSENVLKQKYSPFDQSLCVFTILVFSNVPKFVLVASLFGFYL